MKKHAILAAAISAMLSVGAHAAAPAIAGSFGSGTTTGSVKAESYDYSFDGAKNWTFWTFTADFFSDVSITVTPSHSAFDPIIAVCTASKPTPPTISAT